MSVSRYISLSLFVILISSAFHALLAQTGFQLDIPKPKPYEERVLRAEKTGDKKLKGTKKFFQNLATHYNYYFNASNKLNDVIIKAKEVHKDDYTNLLPFYNYSLDVTSQDKVQLDSVIYKAQTGIVMHDLRNDWIDNLYLLWGAAYYFEKQFDSAALMFQFINYSFADKEKDGYYKYIGSRIDGTNGLSISTKEEMNFPKKLLSLPPSRNNALLWLIRTLIESDNLTQAGTLIATLKNDPVFPERLHAELEEIQAYWYYKQKIWDSSATHLINALDQAKSKEEKARWEYLAAQMFEKGNLFERAKEFYSNSIDHTIDPIMDIYARLNLIRINKAGGENYIEQNIAELLKMAKKDRYADYRDIIYFMAARMEMERNNIAAARELLIKGTKYNNGNPASRNNAYLLIADLSFDQKKYIQSAYFYDSVEVTQLEDQVAATRVENRKTVLSKIVGDSITIARQDSLQRIAAMPEQERTTYITQLVKKLRKQQGLKEETALTSGGNTNTTAPPVDLFTSQQQKGEWYFYNTTLKTQGAVQFKQIWGNRPNVDNWRRFTDVNQQLLAKTPNKTRDAEKVPMLNEAENSPSFNSLLNNLPLTPELLQKSNDSIRYSLFNLGMVYLDELEDYPSAIEVFENLRKRFPDNKDLSDVLFHLYYAYNKAGNYAQAESIKKLLQEKYPSSRLTAILTTGKDPNITNNKVAEATKEYESIYDLFIEGNFQEAEAAKKRADSIYQTNYWQPQLLYIEAVYYIRQRQDSVAKNVLQTLIDQSGDSPMGEKAQTLLSVLSRRKQIEDELRSLQIERPKDSNAVVTTQPVTQKPTIQKPVIIPKDSVVAKTTTTTAPPEPVVDAPLGPQLKKDSKISMSSTTSIAVNTVPNQPSDVAARKALVQKKAASGYTFDPAAKHYTMIILDKVDPLFVNEAKNAFSRYNLENYYNQTFQITVSDLDSTRKLLLIGDFTNAQDAVDYAMKAKRNAPNEIVPWLKPEKYSFWIMTDSNLEVLKNNKDLALYRKFLDQNLPGKF